MSLHLDVNSGKKLVNTIAGSAVLYMAISCPCETYLKCHKVEYLFLLGVMASFALIH
jgi:hypothetical protein